MTFADFSKQLSKIEATPKRLEITGLLAELIKQTDPEEVEKTVNLSLGQLAPLYKDIDFNMAEKMMVKAIARATGEEELKVRGEFKTIGDLGETVENIKNQELGVRNQGTKNSVVNVYEKLLAIAQDSGEDSQERKIEKTSDLLRQLDPLSAKYAIRIILGNLRLGFSDRTVLDALSNIVASDKSARKKLEGVYNVRPDIGWMAKQTTNYKQQTTNWQRVAPQLGTPILPSLCQRLEGTEEIIEKMGKVAVEPKWDGQRIQAHAWIIRKKVKGKRQKEMQQTIHIKLFTRGLENVTTMFPDLVESLKFLLRPSSFFLYPSSFILDGEVIAFDPKTNKILPFQTMITRKRKYGINEQLLNVPIRYMVFDIMYLNGKSLMREPFSERRGILERTVLAVQGPSSSNSIICIAPQIITADSAKIRNFLKRQIDSGLEGIVAKRLDSPYSPGRTGFSWVKLKWEGKAKSGGLVDTIDCVVMGIYAGQGKRAGFGAGAFLVGILDSPTTNNQQPITSFLTISKIGTGLTDEQWRELSRRARPGSAGKAISQPKEYDVPKTLAPDFWVEPKIVVEIQADNITVSPLHTAGFALRFPRLVRYRDDKSPEQATTVEEIRKLYEMQS